jgi:hypothetical protein
MLRERERATTLVGRQPLRQMDPGRYGSGVATAVTFFDAHSPRVDEFAIQGVA